VFFALLQALREAHTESCDELLRGKNDDFHLRFRGKIRKNPLKNTCIPNKTLRLLAVRELAQFFTMTAKEVHQWPQPRKRQQRKSPPLRNPQQKKQ
jgi:hypothetical protein